LVELLFEIKLNKNMKTKKFLITIVIVLGVAVGAIALYLNYGGPASKISDSSLYAEYISAYSSGIVSKKSSITVKLTESAAASIKKEEIDATSLFEFSPSISGKATWVDDKTTRKGYAWRYSLRG
jgi:alpha-2-macroglobulin